MNTGKNREHILAQVEGSINSIGSEQYRMQWVENKLKYWVVFDRDELESYACGPFSDTVDE